MLEKLLIYILWIGRNRVKICHQCDVLWEIPNLWTLENCDNGNTEFCFLLMTCTKFVQNVLKLQMIKLWEVVMKTVCSWTFLRHCSIFFLSLTDPGKDINIKGPVLCTSHVSSKFWLFLVLWNTVLLSAL